MSTLIAVPNVSEGRDTVVLAAIGDAFARGGARVLDVHADADHHRAVFTLAGEPGALAHALAAGARETISRVDLETDRGVHPHVGAIDVVPIVHRTQEERGAACAEALVAADEIGRLGVPVLLYGALAGGRTRAELRRGGRAELARRLRDGELVPDFGPTEVHPSGGATLVAARPPLIAFNLELDASLEVAREVARLVREGGPEGLPGVRALGLHLEGSGLVQVSTNVEDHERTPLAALLEAVARHANVTGAEVVGLPPEAAFEGWPDDVPIRNRRTLEEALRGADGGEAAPAVSRK
jgi:glutamate formiminotransferase / 5-formyltetrahydrofolate cyclo-ligase